MKNIIIQASNGMYLTAQDTLSSELSDAAHHWDFQFEEVALTSHWSSHYSLFKVIV
jgi:hypothetical protein